MVSDTPAATCSRTADGFRRLTRLRPPFWPPQVLAQTQDHRQRVLVAAAKNIRVWFIKVRKIKAIYHTLNLFNLDVTQKCLIAECWVPVDDVSAVQLALRRGSERSGSSIMPVLHSLTTREAPPTFNRTNKFTNGFQTLVDAYGVANYREMNPGGWRGRRMTGAGGGECPFTTLAGGWSGGAGDIMKYA